MPKDRCQMIWLFPITYLIHIAEEVLGGEGYSAYLERLRGIQLPVSRFLIAHGIGLSLMIIGIILARRFRFPNLFAVILGSVIFVNSLTHTLQTLFHREYVPGTVSAVLIWMPLGVATLFRLRESMGRLRYSLCLIIGVGINAVVEVLILSA